MTLRPIPVLALLLATGLQAQMVDELRHQARTETDPQAIYQTAVELQFRGLKAEAFPLYVKAARLGNADAKKMIQSLKNSGQFDSLARAAGLDPATCMDPKPASVAASTVQPVAPYEFKGLALGSGLREFREKYDRPVKGDPRRAPLVFTEQGGSYTVPQGLGLAYGMTYYPFEAYRGVPPGNTIAGVDCELLFQFLDGSLYQIDAVFETAKFPLVLDSLKEKYGAPKQTGTKPLQNRAGAQFESEWAVWSNGVSEIRLDQRAGRVDSARVRYIHLDLEKTLTGRIKAKTKSAAASDL